MKKIWLPALLVSGILMMGVFLFAKDVEVSLTEAQVQAAINGKIQQGVIESRGVELTINSAVIDFKDNNTATIVIDFKAAGFGYSGDIAGEFGTGIRYDSPKFYLDNVVPVNLELELGSESDSKVQDLKNVASDFLNRQKKDMLSDEARQSLGNIVGRNETAIKEFAVSSTYKFFETLPIYDLNSAGLKGALASLALKDVTFTETGALVTLSPVRALIKILSFILAVLGVFTYIFVFYALPYLPNKKSESA